MRNIILNQIPSNLNEIYRELYERLKNYEDSAELYAAVSTEDFIWTADHAVLADHPEFFWIGTSAQVTESALSGEVISYEITPAADRESRDYLAHAAGSSGG